MNSPQESDAEGEIDPDYAHSGWGAAIDPLLASEEAPQAAAPAYGYYPQATAYYPYPAAEEPAFDTTNNPYLEDDPVHNPYLDSPPPATYEAPDEATERVPSQDQTNPQQNSTQPPHDAEPDPLLLAPTSAPLKAPTRPAPTQRKRPQPRARSSATPIPGPNARRKPTSPAAGPSTAPPKSKESKKSAPPPTPSAPHAPAPGPGPARGAVVRDEFCSFCQGTDAKNKAGYPEKMLTCEKCGRSGESEVYAAWSFRD